MKHTDTNHPVSYVSAASAELATATVKSITMFAEKADMCAGCLLAGVIAAMATYEAKDFDVPLSEYLEGIEKLAESEFEAVSVLIN